MTKRQLGNLAPLLPGLQLGIFEIIWPACPWIKSIWLKKGDGQVHFFIEAMNVPDEEQWESCQRHIGEMVDVAARFDEVAFSAGHTIQYGSLIPQDEGYLELMSDRQFKEIATKHAPWRLDSGR